MSNRKKQGLERHRQNMATRFAMIKINAFLKKNNLFNHSQKRNEKINLFRFHHDQLEPLGKKQANKWLTETWRSGQHNFLKPNPPLFGFYSTSAWLSLKRKVFAKYGKICMRCGSIRNIVVDHIKPRSIYPELELDFDNMQVLCIGCNNFKSNKRIIDFRNTPLKISQLCRNSHLNNVSKR